MKIGYALSSEEHAPNDLVRYARLAEEAGFDFAMISDHFHPWIDAQGHSPFVWSVLGAIARETEHMPVGTGVTCPMIRTHPAIVAHAAATTAAMMPGRFWLGLGTGENLNEHVTGEPWPPAPDRIDMLAEAITVIRLLFTGDESDHDGPFYSLLNARLYTLPDELPPIYVAAKGPLASALAARLGDGLIGVGPSEDPVRAFNEAGGRNKPKLGQIHMCWAPSEEEGVKITHRIWPNSALPGSLTVELQGPKQFEEATELVRADDVKKTGTYGPDPEVHADAVRKMADAGYDHVYVHQIGPNQEEFIRFFSSEVMPSLRKERESAVSRA